MSEQPFPFDPQQMQQGVTRAFPPDPRGLRGGPGGRRWNVWAVVSLVAGLFGWIPFLPGAVAVVTGIVGIRKSREPFVGGRPLATTGALLGVISVVAWFLLVPSTGLDVLAVTKVFQGTEEPQQAGRDFVKALSTGDIAAAQLHASGTFRREDLEALSRRMSEWGEFRDLARQDVALNPQPHVSTFQLTGTAEFSGGVRSFEMEQVNMGSGWKVTKLTFVE